MLEVAEESGRKFSISLSLSRFPLAVGRTEDWLLTVNRVNDVPGEYKYKKLYTSHQL